MNPVELENKLGLSRGDILEITEDWKGKIISYKTRKGLLQTSIDKINDFIDPDSKIIKLSTELDGLKAKVTTLELKVSK